MPVPYKEVYIRIFHIEVLVNNSYSLYHHTKITPLSRYSILTVITSTSDAPTSTE
jgi:hypothetical protein